MNAAVDVVVAGHICLDIIPDLGGAETASAEALFSPGTVLNTGPAVLSVGGAVGNTGFSLTKLGVRTALMGKVGSDPFGRIVTRIVKESQCDCVRMIEDSREATSYSVILSPPGFDRMFLHCPGVNDSFHAGEVDYDLLSRARLFHFGYPPIMRRIHENGARELVKIFRRARELGVTTSLDMSLPDPASAGGRQDWQAILENVLPHVDLFLPSAEETLFMLDRPRFDRYRQDSRNNMTALLTGDDLHRLGDRLLGLGAGVVVIKCGHRGIYLRTADQQEVKGIRGSGSGAGKIRSGRELWFPCYHVDALAGATGSGDAAIAGFLAASLRGWPIEDAVRAAAAAGAGSVSTPDPISGIPTWGGLTAALDAGWKTDPLEVKGEGWRLDGTLWIGPSDRQDEEDLP